LKCTFQSVFRIDPNNPTTTWVPFEDEDLLCDLTAPRLAFSYVLSSYHYISFRASFRDFFFLFVSLSLTNNGPFASGKHAVGKGFLIDRTHPCPQPGAIFL
jgi:hypothetical protein